MRGFGSWAKQKAKVDVEGSPSLANVSNHEIIEVTVTY